MNKRESIIIHTSVGDMTLRQISEKTGIPVPIIRSRYYRGRRGDELLRPLKKEVQKIPFRGQLWTYKEISDLTGLSTQLLANRYKVYGKVEEDLVKPVVPKSAKGNIGKKFGMLTIIDIIHRQGETNAVCACDCGKTIVRKLSNVTAPSRNINIQSCGCSKRRARTHGMSKRKEYKAWRHIKERCLNPNSKEYSDYGGRGITICERWKNSFENFYEDMGDCPGSIYSIDRIDVDKGYVPGNCRWADFTTQMRNKRNTIWITHNGETRPLTEWAEIIRIKPSGIYQAKRLGKDLDLYLTSRENSSKKKTI